jgi:hypothetical protein
MMSTKRFIARILVAALFLVGSLALVQAQQANQAVQGITVDLKSLDGQTTVVSIPVVPGTVALVERPSDTTQVKLPAFKNGNTSNAVVTILPFAQIRILVVKGDVQQKDASQPQLVLFMEKAEFSAKDGDLTITFNVPAGYQTVWFQDKKDPKSWHAASELATGKVPGYSVVIISEKPGQIVLQVRSWPEGDPTMGWGPKPS